MSGQGVGSTAAGKPGQRAPDDAAPQAGTGIRRRGFSLSRDLLLLIGFAALFTLGTKAFVAQAFLVPTASMADTLRPGDRVLVNKLIYHLRGVSRGDVVVFSGTGSWGPPPPREASPVARWYRDALTAAGLASNGTDYIKRVIGLPGDRVTCCDPLGRISVNGVPLDEGGYLYPGELPSDQSFSVTVPAGRLWVMGDHRADSEDSRYHAGGPGAGTIPESAVVGRAFLVVWPPSQLSPIPIPATFSQAGLMRRAAGRPAIPLTPSAGGILPLVLACRFPRRPAASRQAGCDSPGGGRMAGRVAVAAPRARR
jgi:signal peptidase I